MEGEYPGAVEGTWGDVIFIMCYGVRGVANGAWGGLGSDFVGDNGWCVLGVVSLGARWR